jgi:protease I
MARDLSGVKVAILVENGFEQVELTEPRKALEACGAETDIVSPQSARVRGWNRTDWGDDFEVDAALESVSADDYDALLLPGGVLNPDRLRINERACTLVRDFFDRGKPVAAICHGPWTLINAGVTEGRRLTSYPSLSRDLENAGAEWVDQRVVVDNGLVTSRKPDDIPAFNEKMIEEFAEGGRAGRRASA